MSTELGAMPNFPVVEVKILLLLTAANLVFMGVAKPQVMEATTLTQLLKTLKIRQITMSIILIPMSFLTCNLRKNAHH